MDLDRLIAYHEAIEAISLEGLPMADLHTEILTTLLTEKHGILPTQKQKLETYKVFVFLIWGYVAGVLANLNSAENRDGLLNALWQQLLVGMCSRTIEYEPLPDQSDQLAKNFVTLNGYHQRIFNDQLQKIEQGYESDVNTITRVGFEWLKEIYPINGTDMELLAEQFINNHRVYESINVIEQNAFAFVISEHKSGQLQ